MQDYSETVAFITGGGSGIGLGLATALGRRGAKVALASTNAAKLADAAGKLSALGITAHAVTLDVAQADQWDGALASTRDALGPVNFLALNAGVASEPLLLEAAPPEQWSWSLDVNLLGAAYGIKAALPAMRASGRAGHVLFTSSIGGVKLSPMMGTYAVAKAGMIAMAEVLRTELQGSAITASVAMPAATKTELASMSALRTPTAAAAEKYQMIDAMLSGGSDPLEIAEFILDRIAAGSFYIFPHIDAAQDVRERLTEMSAALDYGMVE